MNDAYLEGGGNLNESHERRSSSSGSLKQAKLRISHQTTGND